MNLLAVPIEGEMKKSYLDYAMSVIVSRALPDCRDGLKPVHRRILYAMHEANNYHDKPYKKSARVVGDVMGKYHPHGDSAIYGALVRMAQDFSLRVMLVDGQGNFGSMDGDSPAQMRYTEVRLAKISASMLDHIDLNTVDFQDNYDGSEVEPKVLPAQFPNLLVNGANGIAVGMATNIPTHNLGEVIDATCAYIDNPDITVDEMLEFLPAPDFPTGGVILGYAKAKRALATGRGSILVRGKAEIEELGGREAIVITEVPYQVNKAELLKKIEGLVKEKIIEGISDLRDESNKLGVRVVVELKRDAIADVVLNQLYKYTTLQTSFGVNMLALNNGRPMLMNIRDVIVAFTDFRKEVVKRRINHLLGKARARAHVLIGLSLAVANIDEVIAIIRAAPDPNTAKESLMNRYWNASTVVPLLKLVDDHRNELTDDWKCKFTEEQAKAILEMRLQRLTGLEKDKLIAELEALAKEIEGYLEILGSYTKLMEVIRNELVRIKELHNTPRRTQVEMHEHEVDIEDLIQREDMVVTTTVGGYIKRVPLDKYKAQKRGGKGKAGMAMRDDDAITDLIVTNTHTPLLFFSDIGKVYSMKVYKLPLGNPQAKGRALVNLLPLAENEKINNIMAIPETGDLDKLNIMFATAQGNIRRSSMQDFINIQSNGKIAIRLDENDRLIGTQLCNDDEHIILATRQGKALRFAAEALRVIKSRTSDGVRGITLAKEGDSVISMGVLASSSIDMDKRDQYLKIPLESRLKFAKIQDEAACAKLLAKLELDKVLSAPEVLELAMKEQFILSLTENGYGKRTSAYEYRPAGRGGQGITNIDTSKRNGLVVASFAIGHDDEVMLMSGGGTVIRVKASDIRIAGRSTMGVKVIDLKEGEKVISATRIINDGIDEKEDDHGESADEQGTDQV
jgi:DNA gyrase subunit A